MVRWYRGPMVPGARGIQGPGALFRSSGLRGMEPMRSIAFMSIKGGSAKTTTALNVGAALAKSGASVLIVDADPQGNASHVLLGGEPARLPTLAEVLLGDSPAEAAIVPGVWEGVSLIPSGATLADATAELTNEVGRERRLRIAMEGAGGRFDYVLIDTAPTRSVISTNVLNYARDIVVPITPGLFGMLGLGQLVSDVQTVGRYLENTAVRIAGIVLTQVEKNNLHTDCERQLREAFGPLVMETKIPASIKVGEAHARFLSALDYSPKSPASAAYRKLAEEIAAHATGTQDGPAADLGNPRAHHAA